MKNSRWPDGWNVGVLKDICSLREEFVNPSAFKVDLVTLFSVPAFDADAKPEIISGKDVGSTKHRVQEGDVLFCKMNPRKNRVWIVDKFNTELGVCSSEFLPSVRALYRVS